MPFARLKDWARSLRVRLMLWNAAAVFLTAAAVLVVVREGVRTALLREMDEAHREDLEEIGRQLTDRAATDEPAILSQLNLRAISHQHQSWFVQLLDEHGQPTWSSVNSPPDTTHVAELRLDAPASHGGVRVTRGLLEGARPSRRHLVVGSSLSFVDEDMARIDRLALLIGAGALVISPLGGYLLARRSTQPFAELIASAARLRPAQTHERLPTRGTGDELDQLAERFNELLGRIADYWRQKQDFLANAAHELRTPLAAIRGSADVALGSERTREEFRELLADVVDETQALEVLVNQLLLLSAADAQRLGVHAETVALDELAAKAADMFQGVAESRGVALQVNVAEKVVVTGNRHHLRQVINNLLDNAIKYTQVNAAGEVATVAISLWNDIATRQAVLRVADQGVGIAPEHLPRIFERFYRADAARSREGAMTGTGLGLSICQAIVSAHHGTISADSTPGEGSAFTVRLPLAGGR